MVRYFVHGWTRPEKQGFAAVVAAVPRTRDEKVVRVERVMRCESDAMMMLVFLADSLARKIRRHGDAVAGISIEENPPKGLRR